MKVIRGSRARIVATLAVLALIPATTGHASSSTESPGDQSLEVWTWGSVDETLAILGEQFAESHPGVEVTVTEQPMDSYFALMRSALASNSGPDVFQMYANSGIFDYYLGLTPLDEYVTEEQKATLLGWENTSTGRSADGTPYAVPYLAQGYPWYYNKALFAEAGLDPENPPATWDELFAACEALNAAGITPIINGYADGYGVEQFMDVYMTQLMTVEDLRANNADPDWMRPELIRSLEYTQEMLDRGCTHPSAAGFPMWPDSLDNFAAGDGAMFQGLLSDVANWAQFQEPLGDDLGVWPGPLVPDAIVDTPPLDFSPNLAWAINGSSDNPDLAFDWISLVVSPEGQAQAWETNGSMPNTSLADVSSDYAPAATLIGWIEDDAVVKVSGPVPYMRPAVDSTFATNVAGIYTGALTPEELMQLVQTVDDALPPIPEE
jgi:multiple sugar transport system substrate-binding protein